MLFWTALRCATEEDNGRFSLFAQCEESPEISVRGYDHTPLLLGAIEDHHVFGRLETVVTYMSGIVAGLA